MTEHGTLDTKLTVSYDDAEHIMKKRATSFYQAFRHLPYERFQSVAAVYAFCRYADDTVDADIDGQNKEKVLIALDELEEWLKSLYDSSLPPLDLPGQSWTFAFIDTIRRYSIPIDSFLLQIEGQRSDANFHDLQTLEDLILYSKRVAGSVGTMMLPILADQQEYASDPDFIAACENLGIGMQITNILRDVGEDLRTRDRMYLPADLLKEYGIKRTDLEALAVYSDAELVEGKIPKPFIKLWEVLSLQADTYYQDYEKFLDYFHPACRLPIVAAALSYHAITDAVREASYNCFTKRCYTSLATRESLIKQASDFVKKNHNHPSNGCYAPGL